MKEGYYWAREDGSCEFPIKLKQHGETLPGYYKKGEFFFFKFGEEVEFDVKDFPIEIIREMV